MSDIRFTIYTASRNAVEWSTGGPRIHSTRFSVNAALLAAVREEVPTCTALAVLDKSSLRALLAEMDAHADARHLDRAAEGSDISKLSLADITRQPHPTPCADCGREYMQGEHVTFRVAEGRVVWEGCADCWVRRTDPEHGRLNRVDDNSDLPAVWKDVEAMSDNRIDRAAEVLTEAWKDRVKQGISDAPRGHCHAFADALADAGLLATPAHDRKVAAKALRDAADALDAEPSHRNGVVYGRERDYADGQDSGIEHSADLLRDHADLIEAGEHERPPCRWCGEPGGDHAYPCC